MTGRRVGADDDQSGARLFGPHLRKHFADEPVQRFLIRQMAETAQEQQREWFAAVGMEFVMRGVDSGAISVVDSARAGRGETIQVFRILAAAHLHPVETSAASAIHIAARADIPSAPGAFPTGWS